MSDIVKILVTAATTIVGGLFVFVCGQLAVRAFIEPWYEQRKTIGLIAEALLRYAPMCATSGPPDMETSSPEALQAMRDAVRDAALDLRKLSGALLARTFAVPRYEILVRLSWAPTFAAITNASRNLVGLSNMLHTYEYKVKLLKAIEIATSLDFVYLDPGTFGKEIADHLREETLRR